MLLKHVELRRVCQYVRLDHDFKPGLIGVMGPNGIGKSNMVNLIKASLTNDFQFKGRTKSQQVRRGTSADKQARVTTLWEHGGVEFEITRSIQKPNGSRLVIHGEKPLTKTPEINERLQEILGVTTDVIDNYVFVDQGEILKFLSEKPAVRKDSFAQLCGAGHIEKLWDTLGDQIRDDSYLAVNFVDNSNELKAELLRVEKAVTEAQQELQSNQDKVLPGKSVRYLHLLVNKGRKQADAQERLETKIVEVSELNEHVANTKKLLNVHLAKLAELSSSLNEYYKAYNEAVAGLDNIDALQKQKKRYELLCQRRDTRPAAKPQKPSNFVDVVGLTSVCRDMSREMAKAQEVLNTFAADGIVACPTCGTSVDQLDAHLHELRHVVDTYPATIESMNAKIKDSCSYERKLRVWEEDDKLRSKLREEAECELAGLSDVQLPDVSKSRGLIEKYEKKQTDWETLKEDAEPMKQQLAKAEGGLEQLEKEVTELRRTVAENEINQDAVSEAMSRLKDHDEAKVMQSQLEGNLLQSQQQEEKIKEELRRVRSLKSRTRKARKWLADLQAWREVVHRDNFPRIYMASVLEDLVDQVNELLNEFDGPFLVSAGNDLSFTAHNPDGTDEPAASKSGGEMVVLAIAYRLAVNSRFARDVGMMVLDEPSAFLDQKNLGCLASVLQRICEVMKQRRQQLIIITHDQRLERVFDQLIELG